MLLGITQKELEKILDKMIDQLVQAGFMPEPTPEKKKEMITDISQKLTEDEDILLTKDKLNQPETLKLLGAACLIEMKPDGKMDFRDLFKNKLELKLGDKKLLQELYETMIKIKAIHDPNKIEELIKRLDKILEILEQRLHVDNKKEIIKDMHIQKLLADQRHADYGVDTQNPGALLKVFEGTCVGNLTGKLNLALAGSQNAAGKALDSNTGSPDPVGTKTSNAINNLLDGSINSKSELEVAVEKAFKDVGIGLTSPTPTLSPNKG